MVSHLRLVMRAFSVKILRSRPELPKRTLLAPVEVRSSDLEGSRHWKPIRSTIKVQEIAVAEIASDWLLDYDVSTMRLETRSPRVVVRRDAPRGAHDPRLQ
jgi:hypothetical protein